MILERQDDGETIRMKVQIHLDHFDNIRKANLCRHGVTVNPQDKGGEAEV